MAKRRRVGDHLTGGTRDVNPQHIGWFVTQTAADTNTEKAIILPHTIVPQTQTRATIIELIKAEVLFPALGAIGNVAESQSQMSYSISTSPWATAAPTFNHSSVLHMIRFGDYGAFTAGGTYRSVYPYTYTHDFTDSAGHGVLVATENLFIQVNSVDTGLINTVRGRIWYRFKTVGLIEYLGIVQSQSMAT